MVGRWTTGGHSGVFDRSLERNPDGGRFLTVSVAVTDSAGSKASASDSVTIAVAALTVTTTSLSDGMVGTAYSAGLAASGGVPPYTWAASGLPGGLTVSAAGSIGGTPTSQRQFQRGRDGDRPTGVTASTNLALTIAAAPLVVTASLSGGVVGTPVSTTLTASGGVPPYTWRSAGCRRASWRRLAGSSRNPHRARAAFPVSATVTDSAGTSTSGSLSWTIGLPSAPPLDVHGPVLHFQLRQPIDSAGGLRAAPIRWR